jgi:hypothetical protein
VAALATATVNKRDSKSNPDPVPEAKPDPKLSLEDTIAQRLRGVTPRSRTGVTGYNPYDAVPPEKPPEDEDKGKPTDLRKLSEWIRLQREIAELNPGTEPKKPPRG